MQSSIQEEKLLNFDCNEGKWKRDMKRSMEDELALILCTVDLGYRFMKGTEYFVSFQTSVILTEQYNVMVDEELIGTTEYLRDVALTDVVITGNDLFINGVDSDVESLYNEGYSWLKRVIAKAFLSFANIKDSYAG
jgi:hypothetical protein